MSKSIRSRVKNKIIYLDVASSISTVRPAERKIFFDILPYRNYQVFALLKDQVRQYKKENIIQIDCSSKTGLDFYKNIFKSIKNVLIEHDINYIVVRNNVWLGLIVLLVQNIGNMKRIFIRAFPSELLRIHNSQKHNFLKKQLSTIKNRILLLIVDYVLKGFDIIFARSEEFSNNLSLRINRKVFSLPMGFDTNWMINKEKKTQILHKLNPDNKSIIGYIGAIDEGRNIDFIVNIFKGAFSLNTDSILGFIITESPIYEKTYVNSLIQKHGLQSKLNVLGPYTYADMPHLLSNMTVTISPIPPIPPYLVSSPTKTVESIGLGVPVVGNMEIKDQEFIINGSGCGICVKYDVADFVNGIQTILLHPDKEKMAQNGISFINKYRTYEKITDHFESVIVQ